LTVKCQLPKEEARSVPEELLLLSRLCFNCYSFSFDGSKLNQTPLAYRRVVAGHNTHTTLYHQGSSEDRLLVGLAPVPP
jgi:hypothetical protein